MAEETPAKPKVEGPKPVAAAKKSESKEPKKKAVEAAKDTPAPADSSAKGAEVVSLDAFRKK